MASQRHNPEGHDHRVETGSGLPALPAEVVAAVRDRVLAVGVRRTTLTDVARRAGVSRMTLYRLVPDVETLILAVMTREFADLLGGAHAAAARRRTGRARLVAMATEVVRRLPAEPLFRKVVEVDPDLLLPYLTERFGSTQRIAVEHLRDAIADAQADGSVRRGDPELMATAMLMAVAPFAVSARLLEDVGPDAALRELATGLDGWLRP